MNYRHSFHAGNFADLLKHAVVLDLMARLTVQGGPLTVIDTHAGAGLYDLSSADSARSREAEAGVGRLMGAETPAPLSTLRAAVQRLNGGADGPLYPGSPWLIRQALRDGDAYVGCELKPEVHGWLAQMSLRPGPGDARALNADGYEALGDLVREAGRLFVLIDPPFERSDDYTRAAEAAARTVAMRADAVVAIWTPLKDLETFDGLMRDLKRRGAKATAIEARLRPLSDPMKMNGCAMVLIGAPVGAVEAAGLAAEAVVGLLGDADGSVRVWS